MVSVKTITGKGGNIFNKVIKFGTAGIIGSLVTVIAVGLLGEFIGGLLGGATMAAFGMPELGMVVAFDGVLSLFRPQPSGGI